jgi:hypothetical protein
MLARLVAVICATVLGAAGCWQGRRASIQPVHAQANWPLLVGTYPRLDASRLVHSLGDTSLIYFRTDIALRFNARVTDSAKIVFFTRHSMTVVGVTTNGQFFVRMPDPGPSLQNFYDVIDRLRVEPEIRLVVPIEYAGMREIGFASDTARPPIPTGTAYPRDTLYAVTNPADTGRIYYRRLYEIMFSDTASGSSIRALLAKYHARIVGGVPIIGSYIVMMPDPGATWQAVQARRDSLHREPIVLVFMPLIRRDNPPVPRSRFLNSASLGARPILSGYPRLDASRLVHSPGDTTFLYFRVNLALRFKEGVSDSAKRAFFARNSISVIGIGGGQFFVTIPDPGPTLDSLYAAVDRLRSQPEILVAVLIPFTPMSPARFSRYPSRPDAGHPAPRERRLEPLPGQGTNWPLLTNSVPPLDTTRVVRHPTDSAVVYFRTDIALRFKAGVPDSVKAAFFARNGLQVLGVTRSGQFFVRMPDPGSTLQSFYDALDRLEADPSVLLAAPIPRNPWPENGSGSPE